MAAEMLDLLQVFIAGIWTIMTSWHIPGTNFTPAQLLFFLLIAPVILHFVFDLLSVTVTKDKGR